MEAHGVTFVSVTQSFNTTTSMGRLTLNILLSFAQFERELIGERIRDKFAASRARGMWMGGKVPLGYRVEARKLVVVESEARQVRAIFERFVILRSATKLAQELRHQGVLSKTGAPIDKGYLYRLLANRTYLGDAPHKGKIHAGEHEAIVSQELWDRAHAVLQVSPRVRPVPGAVAGVAEGPDLRAGWSGAVTDAHPEGRQAIPLLCGPGRAEGPGHAEPRHRAPHRRGRDRAGGVGTDPGAGAPAGGDRGDLESGAGRGT